MISRFFIDRPIFASVLSILITLAGGIAVFKLPIAQFPSVTPPTVSVECNYPGASAQVVSESVATPIEQQVNGVEGMMYMSSSCTNDGSYSLQVTFRHDVDLNMAQVLVQNRVSLALPMLPDVVKATGVTTRKRAPDILLSVNVFSPDGSRDQLYLSNYATLQIKDELARLPGVSDIFMMGQRDYSMRVWLDPDRIAARGMTAGDAVKALREQNVQVASGQMGQQPVPSGQQRQVPFTTLGRLAEPEQYVNVILKATPDGRLVRLRDVARVDMAAKDQKISAKVDGRPSIGLAIFQLPDANALEVADLILAKMDELKRDFPAGVDYQIAYDTTPYTRESILEVIKTLLEAIALVALVVLLFLQNWRSAIIPLIAVPVAIIGTFAVMLVAGFSLNNLTLFGLVLAIGIVVDDAIVVVEAVEHHIEHGLSPYDATVKAMQQVSGPIIAVGLVLSAVFVPCAFISGITGQFFRQFALTIAVSTIISAFNSLTLSPALAAILLRPRTAGNRWFLSRWLLGGFNRGFEATTAWYVRLVGLALRGSVVVLLVYGGLLGLTSWTFGQLPRGFIPQQDMGYMLVNVQLPDAASLERTKDVMDHIERIALDYEGTDQHGEPTHPIKHTMAIAGQSFMLNAYGSNFGSMFVLLNDFSHRRKTELHSEAIAAELRRRFAAEVPGAQIAVFPPPPIRGVGRSGGFKLMIKDRGDLGPAMLQEQSDNLVEVGNRQPELTALFSVFRANVPQLYADVDRRQCLDLGVALKDANDALQIYLGSLYVNDFNRFDRTWQVIAQADLKFRDQVEHVRNLRVRNRKGQMVPTGSFAAVREDNGPLVLNRYNMYPASAITGGSVAGVSSGDAIALMEKLAERELPSAMSYEWTEMAYLEVISGNTAMIVFAFSVVMVFLVLAAQYESWSLPLAVILVVPLCLLSALTGVWIAGMDINIFTQIGFVVLVGLASKNAILIVEFARAQRQQGTPRREATLEACRLRLRPIVMTSLAFILGVVPLLVSRGAGAEMRRTLGNAVFSGMLGVTLFGLFLTPVFFYVIDWLTASRLFASRGMRLAGSIGIDVLTLGLLRLDVLLRHPKPARKDERIAPGYPPPPGAITEHPGKWK